MMLKKKKTLISTLLSTIFLYACNPVSQTEKDKQINSGQPVTGQRPSDGTAFERPKDQYGLQYSVGNLGGKPVKLPPTIFAIWEYDDSPDTWGGTKEEMKEYKKRPRTYDSVIKSMSFKMRYTDGMLLEMYYQAPQTSAQQYEMEHDRPDSPWLNIEFQSGKRYGTGDMNVYWRNIMSRPKNSSMSYYPTGQQIYSLHEYKLNNRSIHGPNRDLYVYWDKNNNVTTVLFCHDNKFGGRCKQTFLLTPEIKARAIVNYQRIHLKDWQLIQQRVRESIQPYIIDQKQH